MTNNTIYFFEPNNKNSKKIVSDLENLFADIGIKVMMRASLHPSEETARFYRQSEKMILETTACTLASVLKRKTICTWILITIICRKSDKRLS